MSTPISSIVAGFEPERLQAVTGSATAFGAPLAFNPVIMVFDNQSDGDAIIGYLNDSGVQTNWKTFEAGEGLVLDLRANHGTASTFTFPVNLQLYLSGSGTGEFSLSIIHAR